MAEVDAALSEAPYAHILEHVKPVRDKVRRQGHRMYWWRHGEARPGMRRAVDGLKRYIATPRVSKYRLFVWVNSDVIPDSRVNVIALDDDFSFGVLHSRFHESWSLRLGGWHGVGNDPQYTPTTGFETFPFPEDVSPTAKKAVETSAENLDRLRENWLNPKNLVRVEPEVVPGFPERKLPIHEAAAAALRTRTLTNLYNERPTWLVNAHNALDLAVAAAYGWPTDISDVFPVSALETN
jgi:type II restriction/modification system DNA methylase subunit YeeA